MRTTWIMAAALLLSAAPLSAQQGARAVIADPPADATHPARMNAFVIPSHDGALNAVMYVASGAAPHPTLLLLHGFPGNEQNLDLAQAARRAGWNVLTLHYRGSWGSSGGFSFAHAAEDADAALAFLRAPATATRFAIDPARIAVAGHSMGGIMAAHAAARDRAVVGAFLIDPWDIAQERRNFADPTRKQAFIDGELTGDLPPLAGTSGPALIAEIEQVGASLDLAAQMPALAAHPLVLLYTERGIGAGEERRVEAAARRAGAQRLVAATLPTDHSFSDMRIALADRLVDWLGQFAASGR